MKLSCGKISVSLRTFFYQNVRKDAAEEHARLSGRHAAFFSCV